MKKSITIAKSVDYPRAKKNPPMGRVRGGGSLTRLKQL
jgi:hypothetical protein